MLDEIKNEKDLIGDIRFCEKCGDRIWEGEDKLCEKCRRSRKKKIRRCVAVCACLIAGAALCYVSYVNRRELLKKAEEIKKQVEKTVDKAVKKYF